MEYFGKKIMKKSWKTSIFSGRNLDNDPYQIFWNIIPESGSTLATICWVNPKKNCEYVWRNFRRNTWSNSSKTRTNSKEYFPKYSFLKRNSGESLGWNSGESSKFFQNLEKYSHKVQHDSLGILNGNLLEPWAVFFQNPDQGSLRLLSKIISESWAGFYQNSEQDSVKIMSRHLHESWAGFSPNLELDSLRFLSKILSEYHKTVLSNFKLCLTIPSRSKPFSVF